MFSRRGQGSLEYMVVSGIALLLVVVLGFFVWESGFLEPEVPRGKMGFYGVEPTDWGASLDDDLIYITLVNDLDEPVHLDNASITLSGGVVCTGKSLNIDLMPGAKYAVDLDCGFSSSGINLGEYYRADLKLDYTTESGLVHVSSGEVHGGVEQTMILSCFTDGCNNNCPLGCSGDDDPDCGGVCLDCTCDSDTDCAMSCAAGDACCPGCTPVDPDCGPVCVPDGCNSNCPVGCNVVDDPDCGCLGGDGCCGIGCNNAVDADCPIGCVPDGCSGVCLVGCTLAEDPDCGCLSGDGCCGVGCNNAADSDCPDGCVTDGLCNGVCPAGCTLAEDPDCGCLDGDGCCGLGCDFSSDDDCPPACVVSCSSGPGCRSVALGNASVTGDECCGSGDCYGCDAGYLWDGSSCVASCVVSCSSGPGCRSVALANAYDTGDQCCGSGDCYGCDAGYLWNGSACALMCDGVCDGVCLVGCTLAEDPDCGCLSGNGCCGVGCNNAADSDCPVGCVTDGLCNGVCPAGCTLAEDPDCGCLDGDGCCGIGCNISNDNDCPPACVVSCSSGPGCRSVALAGAHVTGDECCGSGSCYACDVGRTWDGSSCSISGGGVPCMVPMIYTDYECTANGGDVSPGDNVPSGSFVSCTFTAGAAHIITRGSQSYISVDRKGEDTCIGGTLDMPVECVVPDGAELNNLGLSDWTCPFDGSYRESVTCTHNPSLGTAVIACTQYGWQLLPDNPGLCNVPWTDPWECFDSGGATLHSMYVNPGYELYCTTTEHASDGSETKVEGTCDPSATGNFVSIGWYCMVPDAASWSCSPYSTGSWMPDGATVSCEIDIPVSYDSGNSAIRVDQRFSNVGCQVLAGTGFNYPTPECRGLSGADLAAIAGDVGINAAEWSCETGFREYMDCTYTPTGDTATLHCTSYGWKGTLTASECSHDWDCKANQVCDTVNGFCECVPNFIDCDGEQITGCEVNAKTNNWHCGFCENDCTVNTHATTCFNGMCSCLIPDAPGWTCTGGYTPGEYLPLGQTTTCTNEADYVRWTLTCGSDFFNPDVECQIPVISGAESEWDCGTPPDMGDWVGVGTVTCTHDIGDRYQAVCSASGWDPNWHALCGSNTHDATYICDSGFAACDGARADLDGCEVNINTDEYNCSGCGIECNPHSALGCEGGSCCYEIGACSVYDLCGTISDGDYVGIDICGGSINCGGCSSDETCYDNVCHAKCGSYDHGFCAIIDGISYCCCDGSVITASSC